MNIHKLIADLADQSCPSSIYDDESGELIISEEGQEIFLECCREIEEILAKHGIKENKNETNTN
jgi:hypothetical protein